MKHKTQRREKRLVLIEPELARIIKSHSIGKPWCRIKDGSFSSGYRHYAMAGLLSEFPMLKNISCVNWDG